MGTPCEHDKGTVQQEHRPSPGGWAATEAVAATGEQRASKVASPVRRVLNILKPSKCPGVRPSAEIMLVRGALLIAHA